MKLPPSKDRTASSACFLLAKRLMGFNIIKKSFRLIKTSLSMLQCCLLQLNQDDDHDGSPERAAAGVMVTSLSSFLGLVVMVVHEPVGCRIEGDFAIFAHRAETGAVYFDRATIGVCKNEGVGFGVLVD